MSDVVIYLPNEFNLQTRDPNGVEYTQLEAVNIALGGKHVHRNATVQSRYGWDVPEDIQLLLNIRTYLEEGYRIVTYGNCDYGCGQPERLRTTR